VSCFFYDRHYGNMVVPRAAVFTALIAWRHVTGYPLSPRSRKCSNLTISLHCYQDCHYYWLQDRVWSPSSSYAPPARLWGHPAPCAVGIFRRAQPLIPSQTVGQTEWGQSPYWADYTALPSFSCLPHTVEL